MRKANHEEILRLHGLGLTAPEIASAVGCTTRTVTRCRKTYGVSQPIAENGGAPITPERLEAIRQMFDDGASRKDIRLTLHVSLGTLQKHFPGRGWSKSEGGIHGQMVRQLNRIDHLRRAA